MLPSPYFNHFKIFLNIIINKVKLNPKMNTPIYKTRAELLTSRASAAAEVSAAAQAKATKEFWKLYDPPNYNKF